MKKRENTRFLTGTLMGVIIILAASSLLYNKTYQSSRIENQRFFKEIGVQKGRILTTKGPIEFSLLSDAHASDLAYFYRLTQHEQFKDVLVENKNDKLLITSHPESMIQKDKPQAISLKHDRMGIIGLFHTGDYVYKGRLYFTKQAIPKLNGMVNPLARITEGLETLINLEKGDKIKKIEWIN